MRQESVAGFQKDRALEEVFRLAPRPDTLLRTTRRSSDRRRTENTISNWMEHQGDLPTSPQEQDRSVVDRLEMRRQARRATLLRYRAFSGTRSVASDPADFMASSALQNHLETNAALDDGDDELNTYEDDDDYNNDGAVVTPFRLSNRRVSISHSEENGGYFVTPRAHHGATKLSSATSSPKEHVSDTQAPPKSSFPRRRAHVRNNTSNTIVYNSVKDRKPSSPPSPRPALARSSHTTGNTRRHTPVSGSGSRTPINAKFPLPVIPPRQEFQSMPNFNLDSRMVRPRPTRRQSSMEMAMSELGHDQNALGAVPSSFATQMAMATGGLKPFGGRGEKKDEDDGMMGRLMLARMKTLEEGFAEVVKEFRGMRTAGNSSVENESSRPKSKGKGRKRRSGLVRTSSAVEFEKLSCGPSEGKGLETKKETPEGKVIITHVSGGSSL